MRLKHIKHSDINKPAWDKTLKASANAQLYANSWYLDVVSPGWEAFVIESTIGYAVIFPLPIKKKFGFKYVVQPVFTSQLGMFGDFEVNDVKDAVFLLKKQFRRFNVNCNVGNTLQNGSAVKKRMVTCELPLSLNYKSIRKQFTTNTKRNIKKVMGITLNDIKKEEYIAFKKENNIGVKLKEYDKLGAILELFSSSEYKCEIIGAWHKQTLVAAAVFIHFKQQIIYLNGASNKVGKQTRAMFAIMDSVIKKYAETGLILDFKGGQMPGTNRFFIGFGAVEKEYFNISRQF